MSVSSQMHRTTSRSDVKRALIVEDNADSASVLSKLLETLGYIVEIARNGTEALTVAASFAPEVVLIDIGLPGLDGWQVARELRRSGGEKTLLIAVTGLWVEKDRFQSKEAGFDHYFMKPLDLEALKSLLVTA
jgi:two-component system, OmpR family, response regulator